MARDLTIQREGIPVALVAFNGTVMRGEPQHENLEGATFVSAAATAPLYRLYSIGDAYPAMVRDDEAGVSIALELYEVPEAVWPKIRDSEPRGLYRGPVVLADGREVEGMLGEPGFIATQGTREITSYGGWREYITDKPEGPRAAGIQAAP
jgi:gamma-glutamylcyclotransferase (GGCT)/AIG2-like uncharacterized protein YtfP